MEALAPTVVYLFFLSPLQPSGDARGHLNTFLGATHDKFEADRDVVLEAVRRLCSALVAAELETDRGVVREAARQEVKLWNLP